MRWTVGLGAALLVASLAIITERVAIAQAAACPMKCTKDADCSAGCSRTLSETFYVCHRTVPSQNPGKQCEKSDNAGDTCTNNAAVVCGVVEFRGCAQNAVITCDPVEGRYNATNSGCIPPP